MDKVEAGGRLVAQAGTTMQDVVASVQRVTDIMAEISAASHEQSAGIEQVNQAIAQMDQVTQQNAALVEEAAAAAGSMQEQAASLSRVVSVFRLADGSGAPLAVRPAVPAIERQAPSRLPAAPVASRSVARPATPVGGSAGGDWEEF